MEQLTVKKFIEELSKFNPDAVITDDNFDDILKPTKQKVLDRYEEVKNLYNALCDRQKKSDELNKKLGYKSIIAQIV